MTVDWDWLIKSNFSFFPLRPASKKPFVPAWKHFQDRRPTADELVEWRHHANLNAAIVTGAVSGIIVLDIDTDAAEAFVQREGVPETLTVRTAKGRHRYFKHPGGDLRNFAGRTMDGLDFRGDGGYVVAPGSIHDTTGILYDWETPPDTPIADPPRWLLDMVEKPKAHAPDNRIVPVPIGAMRSEPAKNRYAEAALEGELAILGRAGKGTRNDQLNRSAFALGQLVGAGVLERPEVERRLIDTARAVGLEDAETARTVRSGLDDGSREPRELPASVGGRHDASPADTNASAGNNGAEASLTEDAIARAFTDRHRATMRFDHDVGAWFCWADDHWARDAMRSAYDECRRLTREASEPFEAKHQAKVQRAQFVNGVERFAQSDQAHAVTQDAWDRDPFLVGAPGVTIDLKSGQARTPDPKNAITKRLSVAPSASADCPRWLAFLDEATGGDVDMVRFLQRLAGYALTGDTREHMLFFIYGPGGNGKSVFLNVLMAIMGDYGQTAPMETFTASQSDRHPTDLASLRGARLVAATETEEGRSWAESRIKQLTGGDPISARFMRQDFFTFRPQFKLMIAGNHKPSLRNVDDAARRRFNLIPFTQKPAKPNPQLEQQLLEEAPAILRWMIDGCLDWQSNGIVRPLAVRRETESYFGDQDIFAQWLADECLVEIDNEFRWESTAGLFKSWSDYATASGEAPGTQRRFGEMMLRAGFSKGFKKINGRSLRIWFGLNRQDALTASHEAHLT